MPRDIGSRAPQVTAPEAHGMSAESTELVAMTKNPEDFEYALRMKREALGPHIAELTLIGLYILPAFQGKGSGAQVLRQILFDAAARGLPVRLRCLKWNPALSLYRRHGFLVIGETETHFQMERPLS
jgi:GNAT superfamily N-acetyltransferase